MATTVKVKYKQDGQPRLEAIAGKSDWIDLRAVADYEIHRGAFTLIDLGVAMELPPGYEAHIVPRSSTFRNFGLIQTNGIGIVDNSYCGPDDWWFMPTYATRDIHIKVGDRVCQFRIVEKQPDLSFEESSLEHNTNRGGHGSTGRN